jgi:hypothetical protein
MGWVHTIPYRFTSHHIVTCLYTRRVVPLVLWIDRTLGTNSRTLGTSSRTLGAKTRTLGTVAVRKILISKKKTAFFQAKTLKLYIKH